MNDSQITNKPLLRASKSHLDNKVLFVELFLDLVFVFAITQLSHTLLHDFTLIGILEAAFLMLAVWWVWVHTAWVTNWLDPQKTPVRFMLFIQMLAGLILATSIPDAFADKGLIFALTFTFMQLTRSAFMCWALYQRHSTNFKNFCRISVWLSISAVFWVLGGFADEHMRYVLWGLALLIETIAPVFGFWTPILGKSTTADWDVSGAHLAERCGLFIIIALGESLLVTGDTFASLDWTLTNISSFLNAFINSVAMWWVYFNIGAERAAQHIETSDDPGKIARLAYTYLHIPIVAGIILVAVSDELILKHPLGHHGHTDALTTVALLGGPTLFLIGNLLFKKAVLGHYAQSHLTGIILLLLAIPAYQFLPPFYLAVFATLVLVMTGIWEHRAVNSE